jgi:adenylate kinase family enzyme
MQKIVILGNSGSGKSTLAARLARESGLATLDIDTIAWLPVVPPRRRPLPDSLPELAKFMDGREGRVVEGCYAGLAGASAARCSQLIFLNPGIDACIANCRARPWEPHKYSSKAEQDKNLAMLIGRLREYETRRDEFSLRSHRALFDGF